jgi:hypothetical protein
MPNRSSGRLLFLALWLPWICSLRWVAYLLLQRDLAAFIDEQGITQIGCIHEMHPDSRIVWNVAASRGVSTATVQHAAISEDKNWFFPSTLEIEAGLSTPEVFFVYNSMAERLLKPAYPGTAFERGSSGRYWKLLGTQLGNRGQEWLFVTALPSFDNRLVLSTLRRLIRGGKSTPPLRLRLHPNAQLRFVDRWWLARAALRKCVTISSRSLSEDLKSAGVVIGSGSTTLVEAIAHERPVLQITPQNCPRYVDLSFAKGWIGVDVNAVSVATVNAAMQVQTDPGVARQALGYGNAEVDYSRLFSIPRRAVAGRRSEAAGNDTYLEPHRVSSVTVGMGTPKPMVVCYPLGAVHARGLARLADLLPEYGFRVYCRRRMGWHLQSSVKNLPFEYVFDRFDRPPRGLFSGDVRGLILPMAAVDRTVADLIEAARRARVPVVGIEEVNQLVLTDGRINHYLMPLDRVLVISEEERKRFLKIGVPGHRVTTTGWAFSREYHGLENRHTRDAAEKNALLSRGDGRWRATLFLSTLSMCGDNSSLESLPVRQELLRIARHGLGDGVELCIKMHPTDRSRASRRIIEETVPDAKILPHEWTAAMALSNTDICLSRGNSQTLLEALELGIPTFVIPCGLKTAFDDMVPAAVIRTSGQLTAALDSLRQGRVPQYDAVLRACLPWTPNEARSQMAGVLQEIFGGEHKPPEDDQVFDLALFRGLLGNRRRAIEILTTRAAQGMRPSQAHSTLLAVLRRTAEARQIEWLVHFYSRPYQRGAILALWLEELSRNGLPATTETWDRIRRDELFPPLMNTHYYLGHTRLLARALIRAKRIDEARELAARVVRSHPHAFEVKWIVTEVHLAARGQLKMAQWLSEFRPTRFQHLAQAVKKAAADHIQR